MADPVNGTRFEGEETSELGADISDLVPNKEEKDAE